MLLKPEIKLQPERRRERKSEHIYWRVDADSYLLIAPWDFVDEEPVNRIRQFLARNGIKPRPTHIWTNLFYPTYAVSLTHPSQKFFYGRVLDFRWSALGLEPPMSDHIVGVANKEMVTGLMWVGMAPQRHHHLLDYAWEYGSDSSMTGNTSQGFVDNHGRFLDRYEAFELAKSNGQFKRKDPADKLEKLFSEDLW